jgi:flagellar biosynthesis protein FlhA
LTVGDGIATQIPALVIATATGIIVTRAATDGEFGKEISSQITRYPQSLVMLSVALLGFLLLPGIPVFPVLTILLLVGVLLFIGLRRADSNAVIENDSGSISSEPESDDIYQKIEIQPIEIHLSDQVSDSFGENNSIVAEKIKAFRTQLAYELGFVLPNVDIVQNGACPQSGYEIRLYGSKVAEGVVYPEHYLAISANELNSLDGIATKDPTYGLPALWVTDEVRDKASSMGCTIVDATTVMVTHITEVLRNNIHEMLTRDVTEKLVSRIKNSQPGLYDELIPGILSITDIQKVLQRLLSEKVSIRNMEHILEVLLDSGRQGKSTDELVENVRQRLARVICEPLLADNLTLNVLTFDPLLEQKLQQGLRVGENSTTLQIDPMLTESVLKGVGREMEKMMGQSLKPVLLCSPSLRSHIKKVTERVYPYLNVISLTEIPKSVSINSFSVVMSDRGSIDNKRQEVVA